ncbi:unnamed protein product [Aspergillus oryzae]|nr:unnamed protein product [Aspergillus oryzae]
MLGQGIGPVFGGLLAQYLGFRSIFWFLTICASVSLFTILLLLPETLRSIAGNGTVPLRGLQKPWLYYITGQPGAEEGAESGIKKSRVTFGTVFAPLKFLFEIDVFITLFFGSIVYTVWSMVTSSTSDLFEETYNLTTLQVGLTFLGNGCMSGSYTIGYLMDYNHRLTEREYCEKHNYPPGTRVNLKTHPDFPIETARMRNTWWITVIFIVCVAVYGVSLRTHLAVPIILQYIIAYCSTGIFTINSALVIDLYPGASASATAVNNLMRCLIGAAGVAAVQPIIDALGPTYTFVLLADFQFDPFGPGATAYDNTEAGLDGIDWNDPASALKAIGAGGPGGLPFPETLSPEEVRRQATARSDEIFTSYETLHRIIQRHEATIQKRWSKKTRQQRLNVLLSAWPDMPAIHRPDFDAFRRESASDRVRGTKYRVHFMWPYVNQEDLLNTKALPLLLNSRGRHPPSHFAAADMDAMHLGLVSKAIVPIFLNCHVLILNGMTENTRDYGQLVAWEDHPDAFDWMHKQKQFLPGEGLLVMEAQARLLSFLVQCCQQLLHDIPESTLTSNSFPVLPEPQIKPESEISGFESLGVIAAEAPYRVPAQIDLRRIASLLAARASAAEDHLWALREDPDYFARTLLECKEHLQEMLKDLDGKSHPVLGFGRDNVLWARILGSILSEAYLRLELFSELSSQAGRLVAMQKMYADDISPSKDLPEAYLEALLRLRYFLTQAAKGPLSMLRIAGVASPPLRRFFARVPPPDPYTSKISVTSKPGAKMNKVETQLIWLLRNLWEDGYDLFLFGMPLVVDELGRLLQSEKQAQELLSSYITEVIGDLSIFSQCLHQLALYHPWARSFESELVDREDKVKQEFAERTQSWARILAALKAALPERDESNKTVDLGKPTEGKFTYPFEKRRTKENVTALRNAESCLDAFWAAIDQTMVNKAGDLSGTAVRNLLSQPRILQRTREWIEPEKPQRASQDKPGGVDLYTLYQPVSSVYSGLSARALDISQPKTKVKTRGTSHPVRKTEALPRHDPVDRQPTFSVDTRALKVFRAVFFNPATTSTPGEVSWNDFLHAMTSVGFSAMKLYGSVWQFQPTRLDVERNILFHEPHPQGKLPFKTARQYGRESFPFPIKILAKRRPRILKEQPVQVVAGNSKTCYFVHPGALSGCHTSALNARINGPWKENGADGPIDWTDFDEETVGQAWLCKLSQSWLIQSTARIEPISLKAGSVPADEPTFQRPLTPLSQCLRIGLPAETIETAAGGLTQRKLENSDDGPAVEIVLHAKVYCFAHRFLISDLESFALQRLTQVLIAVDPRKDNLFPYLADAVRVIYNSTPGALVQVNPARKLLSQYVALNYTLLANEQLVRLLDEGGEFLADLSQKLARRLTASDTETQSMRKHIARLQDLTDKLKADSDKKERELKKLRGIPGRSESSFAFGGGGFGGFGST